MNSSKEFVAEEVEGSVAAKLVDAEEEASVSGMACLADDFDFKEKNLL